VLPGRLFRRRYRRLELWDLGWTRLRIWGCDPVQRCILVQDGALELLERWAWVDAELIGERLPRLLVCLQRLGLATRPVQGQHQLAAQPLAQRMGDDQRLKLTCQLGVAAAGKVGLDPILERT
jgi:hypothetical protein